MMNIKKNKIIELKNVIARWVKNKNNSKIIIIFSIIGLLISYQLKVPKETVLQGWYEFSKNNIKIPNHFFCVNIFGLQVSYNLIVVVLLISLGIGIYSVFLKEDN